MEAVRGDVQVSDPTVPTDCLIVAISQLISALHPGGRLVSQIHHINACCTDDLGSNAIQWSIGRLTKFKIWFSFRSSACMVLFYFTHQISNCIHSYKDESHQKECINIFLRVSCRRSLHSVPEAEHSSSSQLRSWCVLLQLVHLITHFAAVWVPLTVFYCNFSTSSSFSFATPVKSYV